MRASKRAAILRLRLGLGWWADILPAAGLTFICFAKEKVSKRKASPRPCPCGVPCATRIARGRAQARCAQTSARPDPYAAALLSTAKWPSKPEHRVCLFASLTLHTPAHHRCHCHRRSRSLANPQASSLIPQSIYYDCHVHQSGRTNLHRHLSHQRPYPVQKIKLAVKAPLHPGGGEGAGGKRGTNQAR